MIEITNLQIDFPFSSIIQVIGNLYKSRYPQTNMQKAKFCKTIFP